MTTSATKSIMTISTAVLHHCGVVLQEQKNNVEYGVGTSVSCWCQLSMVLTLEFFIYFWVYNFIFYCCVCVRCKFEQKQGMLEQISKF
jgi:hypothetical protein